MSLITPLIRANAPLLRRLQAGPPPASKAALAEELGRDKSNLGKTLKALEGEGVIDAALSITAEGEAGLAELAAEAAPVAGELFVPHNLLQPNPDNPRKAKRDPAVTASRAESILELGVLQPLIVTPPAADTGIRTILAGEGRWLSVQLLVGEGRASADFPMPCRERDADKGRALQIALAENANREDLDPLDRAIGWHDLVEGHGISARALALQLNEDPRVVQEGVKVVREATPDHLAQYRAGELTFEQLRYAVRTPGEKPPEPAQDVTPIEAAIVVEQAELTPHEILALVEIEAATKLRPNKDPLGPSAIFDQDFKLSDWPPEAELAAKGFIVVRNGYPSSVTLLRPAQAKLGHFFIAGMDPAARLMWARMGAGLTPDAIAELEAEELFDRSWLNERNPPPKITPAEALVLIETLSIDNGWPGAEISPDYDRGVIGALKERRLIDGPYERNHRTYLGVSHQAKRGLERQYPGAGQKKPRTAHLAALREQLGLPLAEGAEHSTSWLNGPHPLPPDVAEREAAEKLKEEERKARAERQREAEEELKAKRELAVDRLEADFPGLDAAGRTERFAEVLNLLGAPSPWKAPTNGYSYYFADAANGHRVEGSGLGKRLMMLAVNALAGVDFAAFAASKAEAARPPSEAQFLAWVAEAFMAMEPDMITAAADQQARLAVNRYLEDAGEDGGPGLYADVADNTWDRDVAQEIADGWAEDFELDCHVTPEASTDPHPEAVEDAEITPALARLAGVQGQAEAVE